MTHNFLIFTMDYTFTHEAETTTFLIIRSDFTNKSLLITSTKKKKRHLKRESPYFCEVVGANHWGRKTERGKDGATGARGNDSDGARGNESESEREWETKSNSDEARGNKSESNCVFFELEFFWVRAIMDTWTERKPSTMDSISFKPNRLQWTRFLGLQTESNELGFLAYKASPMNPVSRFTNWVQWTRFFAYVDTLATSAAGKTRNSSTIYSIL